MQTSTRELKGCVRERRRVSAERVRARAPPGERLGQARLLVGLEVHEDIPGAQHTLEGRVRHCAAHPSARHALIPFDVCELVHGLVHVRRFDLEALSTVRTGVQANIRGERTFSPARNVFSTVLPGARWRALFR